MSQQLSQPSPLETQGKSTAHILTTPQDKKRLSWWLGIGVVLGSCLAYTGIYMFTESTSKQWFEVLKDNPTNASPPAPLNFFLRPQAAHANSSEASDAEDSEAPTTKEVILTKKAYFKERAKAYEARMDENHALYENLGNQLTALGESDSTSEIHSELTAAASKLRTLAEQSSPAGSSQARMLELIRSANEQIRLLEQIRASESGAINHARIALHFHSQEKAAIKVSLILGIAAGSLGVLISRNGWERSDNRFIYSFALISAMALVFNQLPRVMQSDINFQNNRDIYLGYLTLSDNIHTFVATDRGVGVDPKNPDLFKPLETNRFIHSVDNKLAELNQLRIGMDATQRVDISDALKIPTSPTN